MSATTTNRGYTYPDSTDDVRPHEDIQTLAEDVDADVQDVIERPAGRLVQQSGSTQTLAHGAGVAITFGSGSEDLDTHGFHSTASNTDRVTPTVAGWYNVRGSVAFAGRSDYTGLEVTLAKNGSAYPPAHAICPGNSNRTQVLTASAKIFCNGSGDYFHVLARHFNGASSSVSTVVSTQFASALEWEYDRPAA